MTQKRKLPGDVPVDSRGAAELLHYKANTKAEDELKVPVLDPDTRRCAIAVRSSFDQWQKAGLS